MRPLAMPSTRYTVRLPEPLDAAVQERVRQGTPFAVLMREALTAYLAMPQPTPADSADTLRAMQAQLAAVTARVEILELALTAVPTPRPQDTDSAAADRVLTPAD